MKTIGMLGGMSWESSVTYYRLVNELVKQRLGGLHSAKCLLNSVDFHEIEQLQRTGDWDTLTLQMIKEAKQLENGCADFLVICSNTMHKMADEVEDNIDIPLLHIADATAQNIKDRGMRKVGLLGTHYTMEQDFYKGRLTKEHGLEVVTPGKSDRDEVHRIIFEELCQGEVIPQSRYSYLSITDKLVEQGAEAVILGCTEISLLIEKKDTAVPLFDTTRIHAEMAVEIALKN